MSLDIIDSNANSLKSFTYWRELMIVNDKFLIPNKYQCSICQNSTFNLPDLLHNILQHLQTFHISTHC